MRTLFTDIPCTDRESASSTVAERAADALRGAIEETGSARLALSGGNTPHRAMELLAGKSIRWEKVVVGLVDDRFVPPDHEGSNERLVKSKLMTGNAATAEFLPMWHDDLDYLSAADVSNKHYGPASPFDFMLLGMGGDGHTASWFPQTKDLRIALSSDKTVIGVDSEGVPGARDFRHRITLTRAAIESAKLAVLLLFGEDRIATFQESLQMDAADRPIRAAVDALGTRLIVVTAP